MEKLKALVKSRKFWAAVAGVVVVGVKAYDPDFPLSDEQMTSVIVLLAAYILGTGLDNGAAPGGQLRA